MVVKGLKGNLEAATDDDDVYIQRCNHAPCDTQIALFQDADSSKLQKVRPDLMTFLKGSCKAKIALKEMAELYAQFEKVWALRERHMVEQLPSQYYTFFLLPCCGSNCPHPVCQHGQPSSGATWFECGPLITYLPLPVQDEDHSWGQQCNSCSECYGHYLDPEQTYTTPTSMATSPPSGVILDLFKSLHGAKPSQQQIKDTAEQVLLSPADVEMWLEHIISTVQLNRKRGAAKAAATRRKKKQNKPEVHPSEKGPAETYRCGVCSEEYEEETVEELWIQCDKCLSWFMVHGDCVGVNPSRVPENFLCDLCLSHK